MAGRGSQQSRILHSDSGSTGSYAVVENVTNIGGPNGQSPVVDLTDLLSTGKESTPGLPDYGQITLDINWRGATEQVALYDMFSTSADAEYFKIAMPTASAATTFDTLTFTASVIGCTFGLPVDGKQSVQITLKTSGAVTLAQNVALASLA